MNLEQAVVLRDASELEQAKQLPQFKELIGGTKFEPLCYPCLMFRDCHSCKRVCFMYRQGVKAMVNQLNSVLWTMFGKPENF